MIRRVLIVGLVLVCIVTVCAVALQRHELVSLRSQQKPKFSEHSVSVEKAVPDPALEATASSADVRELLQLRNQAGQLRRQRDELLPLRAEHQALLEQLAARGTNSALPANYVRKSEARLVGYKSPEETLQSFLYSIRMRDVGSLSEAFTPETAARMKSQVPSGPKSLEKLLEDAQPMLGLSIISQKQIEENALLVEAQMLPGLPTMKFLFRLTHDQWKIESLP